jgi:hypothetical protein
VLEAAVAGSAAEAVGAAEGSTKRRLVNHDLVSLLLVASSPGCH